MSDDDLMLRLAGVDPVRGDPAPAPGSPRYRDILLRAEAAQRDQSGHTERPGAPDAAVTAGHRSRRRGAAAALVASAAAVLAAAMVFAPGQAQSAQAAIAEAATATSQYESLRGRLTLDDFRGTSATATIEYDAGDSRVVEVSDWGTFETIVVGDRVYEIRNGRTSEAPYDREAGLAPFAASAASVLTAALASAEVTEVGTESLDGVEAVHYAIALDGSGRAALEALTPGELAWFELESTFDVPRIELWVSEGLIRRIVVHGDSGTATTEFWDFGAAIEIEAPGPSRGS